MKNATRIECLSNSPYPPYPQREISRRLRFGFATGMKGMKGPMSSHNLSGKSSAGIGLMPLLSLPEATGTSKESSGSPKSMQPTDALEGNEGPLQTGNCVALSQACKPLFFTSIAWRPTDLLAKWSVRPQILQSFLASSNMLTSTV